MDPDVNVGDVYFNLGTAATALAKHTDAVYYFQSAARVYGDVSGDEEGKTLAMAHALASLVQLGRYEEVLEAAIPFLRAFELANHPPRDPLAVAHIYKGLAEVRGGGRLPRGHPRRRRLFSRRPLMHPYSSSSRQACEGLARPQDALGALDSALVVLDDTDKEQVAFINQSIGRLHNESGHFDTAIPHHDTAASLFGELDIPTEQAAALDSLG